MVPPVVVEGEVLEADDPGPGPVPGRLPAHDARAALCGLPELPPAEGTAERGGGAGCGRGELLGLAVWSQVRKGERSRGFWKWRCSDGGVQGATTQSLQDGSWGRDSCRRMPWPQVCGCAGAAGRPKASSCRGQCLGPQSRPRHLQAGRDPETWGLRFERRRGDCMGRVHRVCRGRAHGRQAAGGSGV